MTEQKEHNIQQALEVNLGEPFSVNPIVTRGKYLRRVSPVEVHINGFNFERLAEPADNEEENPLLAQGKGLIYFRTFELEDFNRDFVNPAGVGAINSETKLEDLPVIPMIGINLPNGLWVQRTIGIKGKSLGVLPKDTKASSIVILPELAAFIRFRDSHFRRSLDDNASSFTGYTDSPKYYMPGLWQGPVYKYPGLWKDREGKLVLPLFPPDPDILSGIQFNITQLANNS